MAAIIDTPEVWVAPDQDTRLLHGFISNTAVDMCRGVLDAYLPEDIPSPDFIADLHDGARAVVEPFINPGDFNDLPAVADIVELLTDLARDSGSGIGDISRLPAALRGYAAQARQHMERLQGGSVWHSASYRDRFAIVLGAVRQSQQSHIPLQRHRYGH